MNQNLHKTIGADEIYQMEPLCSSTKFKKCLKSKKIGTKQLIIVI